MGNETEVVVEGVSYRMSELSEEARAHLNSLQFVNAQIAQLQAQLAVYQTARNAYQHRLAQLVPRTRH